MTGEGRRPCWAALAAALGILAWRILAIPTQALWRDVPAIVAVYAAFLALNRAGKAWPGTTATVTAYLLGLYVAGQAPPTLALLGLGR